jgi:hypothetical protein
LAGEDWRVIIHPLSVARGVQIRAAEGVAADLEQHPVLAAEVAERVVRLGQS